jgi:hypothetical protein
VLASPNGKPTRLEYNGGRMVYYPDKEKKETSKTVDLIMKESGSGGTQRNDSKSEGQR